MVSVSMKPTLSPFERSLLKEASKQIKCSTGLPKFCHTQYEFLGIQAVPEIKEFCGKSGLETARH